LIGYTLGDEGTILGKPPEHGKPPGLGKPPAKRRIKGTHMRKTSSFK